MKKITSILIAYLFLFTITSFAQGIAVTENSENRVVLEFKSDSIYGEKVSAFGQTFAALRMKGYGTSFLKGAPQLPVLSKFISVPVCDSLIVTVLGSEYEEFDFSALDMPYEVFPSQGSRSKSDNTHTLFKDDNIYTTNAFFSLSLVEVQKAGVLRSSSVAGVDFAPVSYNPVSQKIRVCTKAVVSVEFANVDKAATYSLSKYSSPMFGINEDLIVNHNDDARAELNNVPISYLIIAHSMFRNNAELDNFVTWKKKLGYYVKIAYTDESNVGTTTSSIKNFIKGRFENATVEEPAPDFLLLVGDKEQVPAFQGTTEDQNHITDLYYATIVGNDYLPDCYYGRLSAQSQTQLTSQINKILMYEQYTMPDPSYLGSAVLIAGADDYFSPTHANGQINYINQNYINTQNPNYDNVMVHLHNCSSQAALIRSEVSAGAGWVNYTAHGDWDGWYQPQFNNSQVASLQNEGKYGVMIGNCCLSGKFDRPECFGEALLRAENKGAMAYIGASNSSYWDEDYYWAVGQRNNITANPTYQGDKLGVYDRLFHQHGELSDNYISTIGGMIFAGNMSVQGSASTLKQYYWEIYHCFGDPSIRAYLGVPSELQVECVMAAPMGMSEYTVQTAPHAYVAVTYENEVIAAAFANAEGTAILDISAINMPGTYQLAVSAQNKIVKFLDIQIISPNTSFVIANKAQVAENTDFQSSSIVDIDVELLNVGSLEASNVYSILTTDNQEINIIKDSLFAGNIATQATFSQNGAFSFVLPSQVKDNNEFSFLMKLYWDTLQSEKIVKVTVKLPDVKIQSYEMRIGSNKVYSLSQGDEAEILFTNRNYGHAKVEHGLNDLTCNYTGATVLSPSSSFHNIDQNQTFDKAFTIKIAENVPDKSVIPFYYHTIYGNVHIIDTINISVGLAMEDFESGDFSQNDWNMQDKPWIISNVTKYAGEYSARSGKNLGSWGRSRMSIVTNSTETATFSYYRKVATEEGYDIFYLYMDGNVVDEASGIKDWEYVSIEVPAGTHTFMFSYEKDSYYLVDSDCVWIDNIIFPQTGVMVVEDIEDEVGINNPKAGYASVYPNPANTSVYVDSKQPVDRIELYDLNGRKVKALTLNGEYGRLVDVRSLTSGVYLMQITFGDGNKQNLKIVKQ